MTARIEFRLVATGGELGSWTLVDDRIVPSNAGAASVLDAALTSASPDEAWERYASWTNGYVISQVSNDTQPSLTIAQLAKKKASGWAKWRAKQPKNPAHQDASLQDIQDTADQYGPSLPRGSQGEVHVLKGPLGAIVVKQYRSDEVMKNEVFAAKVADVLGAPVPRIEVVDDKVTIQDFVQSQGYEDVIDDERDLVDRPGAERLALLDFVVSNTDRHRLNAVVTPSGEVVGIDHGFAFEFGGPPEKFVGNPFIEEYIAPGEPPYDIERSMYVYPPLDHPFPKAELQAYRTKLASMRGEFQAAFDWKQPVYNPETKEREPGPVGRGDFLVDGMLARMDLLIESAKR